MKYRKIGKWLLYMVAIGWLLIGVMELFYRFQWIDFYRTELNYLNEGLLDNSEKPTILVFGDSFSAAPNSWVSTLREAKPGYRFINSAVPGTGPVQAHLMAPGRIKRFQPEHVILQLYVGNDLFDIRYPYDSKEIGFFRKSYWFFSSNIRSLSWANYKSGQLFRNEGPVLPDSAKIYTEFHPEYYNEREKFYLKVDPTMIGDHVLISDDRREDYQHLLKRIKKIGDLCQENQATFTVLVIPHCAQVGKEYYQNMRKLGARLPGWDKLHDFDFPFYSELALGLPELPNLRVLNGLEFLTEFEAENGPAFFANDIHLNKAGQSGLGEWVSEELLAD